MPRFRAMTDRRNTFRAVTVAAQTFLLVFILSGCATDKRFASGGNRCSLDEFKTLLISTDNTIRGYWSGGYSSKFDEHLRRLDAMMDDCESTKLLWSVLAVAKGDLLRIKSIHTEGSASTSLLRESLKQINTAIDTMNRIRPDDKRVFVPMRISRASTLSMLGGKSPYDESIDLLSRSISELDAALEMIDPGSPAETEIRARTLSMRSGNHFMLGKRLKRKEAIAHFKSALADAEEAYPMLSLEGTPAEWLVAVTTKSGARLLMARESDWKNPSMIRDALHESETALSQVDKTRFPWHWAALQGDRSIILLMASTHLDDGNNGKYLREAELAAEESYAFMTGSEAPEFRNLVRLNRAMVSFLKGVVSCDRSRVSQALETIESIRERDDSNYRTQTLIDMMSQMRAVLEAMERGLCPSLPLRQVVAI